MTVAAVLTVADRVAVTATVRDAVLLELVDLVAVTARTTVAPVAAAAVSVRARLRIVVTAALVATVADRVAAAATVRAMLGRRTPYCILGKPQAPGASERSYAPLYYRVKRFVGLPKVLVPAARQAANRAAKSPFQ